MLHITENLCKEIAMGDSFNYTVMDRIIIDEGRWTRDINVIFEDKNDGKLYELEYESGLTEGQEDYYWEQDCPEVESYQESIVVTKYRKI